MAWFFRVLQLPDDRLACRHGRVQFDIHAELGSAIQHMRAMAKEHQPAEIIVHRLDGTVQSLGLM